MWSRLIWLSLIGLGVLVAWYTRPSPRVPQAPAAQEEIVESTEPSEAAEPVTEKENLAPVKAASAPSKASLPAPSQISQRRIEDSIRADIYCENDGSYRLPAKLFFNEEDRRLRILKSLFEINFKTKAFEDVLTALLSKQRDAVLKLLEDCPNEECQFLKALVLTNQISVKGETRDPDVDFRKGLTILRTLKFMNRDNSIYPYFMLYPQKKLGEKYNLKLTFKDFLRAPRFENPFIPAYVALAQAGQFNATAHLYADEFTSVIGVPEYAKGSEVIAELIKDKDFDSELSQWAKHRLDDFHVIREKNLFAPAVLIVELAQLKSLARIFWEKAGTGPAPMIFDPDGFKEFLKLRSELEFEGSQLQVDARTKSHCFAEWDLKRETQSRYSHALSEMIHRWENPLD